MSAKLAAAGLLLGIAAVAVTAQRQVGREDTALPPLPASAAQVPDRVSLDDPTADASAAAVLAAPLPRLEAATPYTRPATAQPYEHRGTIPLDVPPEPTAPVTGTPRPVAPISGSGGR